MYLRAAHAVLDVPTLRQFIRQNALGILTTAIESENYPKLQCSHIPFLLDLADEDSESELGRLRGHMARANPHAKSMIEQLKVSHEQGAVGAQQLPDEVMILFNGPVDHYVTPKFYVETKPTTGKVVPTWNYSAVQAYGRATVYYDTSAVETGEFLSKQLRDLSHYSEKDVMKFQKPWTVEDAPESYVNILKKMIIGFEVEITRLEGKFKMSQELQEGDRQGVIEGFKKMGTDEGNIMADTVKQRGELKSA